VRVIVRVLQRQFFRRAPQEAQEPTENAAATATAAVVACPCANDAAVASATFALAAAARAALKLPRRRSETVAAHRPDEGIQQAQGHGGHRPEIHAEVMIAALAHAPCTQKGKKRKYCQRGG